MKETIFLGKKKPEGFKIYRRNDMQKLLDSVEEGVELEIVIRQHKKKRSNKQLGYYRGCLIPIVLEGLIDAGYDRKELNSEVVHQFLCRMFLKKEVPNENGEFIELIQSTSDLTTSGMMDYIAQIQMWGASILNLNIPDPNQQADLDL